MESALKYAGFDLPARTVLLSVIADSAKKPNGKINLFTMSLYLDHTGSTGIRDNTLTPDGVAVGAKVKPELLTNLKSYGDQTTGKLYSRDFGRASIAQELTDTHFADTDLAINPHTNWTEYAGLLQVFGRYDSGNPEPYFTFDDIDKLWIDGAFRTDWVRPSSNTLHLTDPLGFSGNSNTISNIMSQVSSIPCPDITRGASTETQRNQCENCGHMCTGCKLDTGGFMFNSCKYNP